MEMRARELRRFGQTVRKLRAARGLSQDGFAARVQLHRTYVGGIERGERNPTLVTICRLADALGVPAWKLLREMSEQ
jgi:transcriptional regulator with XRE-family HTH domain